MREWNELKSTPFFHPFELPFGFLDAIWARKRRCSNNCSNAIYLFHLKTEPSLITFKRLHTYTLNIWNTKTSKVRSFVLWMGFTFNQTHFHRLHRHSIYLSIHPSIHWQWNENRLGRILPSQHKTDNSESISMNFHSQKRYCGCMCVPVSFSFCVSVFFLLLVRAILFG